MENVRFINNYVPYCTSWKLSQKEHLRHKRKNSAVEKNYATGNTEQEEEKERRNERNLKAYIVYEQ
jgi:hypothetical protein